MKRTLYITTLLLTLCMLACCLFSCVDMKQTPAEPEESIPPIAPSDPSSIAPSESDPDLLPTAEEQETLVLFLGDSIGEGLAGPGPLTERENYAYYGIIGNINGFTYYNRAVSGYTTSDLAAFVQREDDGVNMVNSLISCADVIHISIIGNDFLNSSHAQMMIDLSNGIYDRVRTRQYIAKRNIKTTLEIIREKNPDATIIMQTLYNPTGADSPLVTPRAREELAKKGIYEEGYHALMGLMLDEINAVLYECLEELTVTDEAGDPVRPFELIDVYTLFEEVYESDMERWTRLFSSDGVHPKNEGHALIAQALQAKIEELGLASEHALKRYRNIRTEQLDRLYTNSIDLEEGKKQILGAEDMAEVTATYFDLIEGILPRYESIPEPTGRTFTEMMNFSVDSLTAFGTDVAGFLDPISSNVYFNEDGDYEIYLEVSGSILGLLKDLIKTSGGIDLAAYDVPIDFALYYVDSVTPGATRDDLRSILLKIEEFYGFSLDGLDYDSPAAEALFDRFKESGEIIFDDPDLIGNYLAFRSVGKYRIEEVTSPLTGECYTAIYLNNGAGRSESFLRFTYREEGSEKGLRLTVDVIHLETDLTRRD